MDEQVHETGPPPAEEACRLLGRVRGQGPHLVEILESVLHLFLQHRAHTLAFWMMWTMAVPAFVGDSQFAVESSHDPVALFTVSALALAANVALAVYQIMKMVKGRKNPLKVEIYDDTDAYRRVVSTIPGASDAQLEAAGVEKEKVPASV